MQGVWEENCDEGERALEKMRAEIKGCGASIGERVTNEISERFGEKKKRSILEIKPEHFGNQHRNLSGKVDEILYNYEDSDL